MITRFSPIYRHQPNSDALNDERARVLIGLCQSKMSFDDIAAVLNCNKYTVRSLLSWPYRSVDAKITSFPEEIELDALPLVKQTSSSADAGCDRTTIPNQEKVADDLAIEICQWIDSFKASDAERQQAIEYAGLDLEKNSTFRKGKYLFHPYQVTLEIIGIWSPFGMSSDDHDFRTSAGRWLASWIRFWIADPEIWDRALDLAYAHFGGEAQAA